MSKGASLTRLVPGEGAEKISHTLAKTQKQFSHISEQILKKVETQKAAQEMKQEVSRSFPLFWVHLYSCVRYFNTVSVGYELNDCTHICCLSKAV